MPSWTYRNESITEIDESKVGFVYVITQKSTGRRYVGKKLAWSTRKLKPLAGKKRRRIVTKESDWKTYTSSSKYIKAAITEFGIADFEFEILELFESKAELNMSEMKLQVYWRVLDAKLADGSRAFFNENINLVYYSAKNDIILTARLDFDNKYRNPAVV